MKLKTKVGPKGQIVIPKPIREKLKIAPSDTVLLDLEGDQMILTKAYPDPVKAMAEMAEQIGGKWSEILWGDELYEEVFGGKYGVPRRKRLHRGGRGKR
jgi:AbrB family looped-hinge helix DNA binding protein